MQGIVKGGLNDAGSSIASIQRGTTTLGGGSTPKNVTISTVNLNNAVCVISSGMSANTTGMLAYILVKGKLTSSTNLELRVDTYDATFTPYVTVSWMVIEYNNVKSVQRGDVVFTTATSTPVTISAVNTNKSMIITSLMSTQSNYSYYGEATVCAYFNSSTQINIDGGGAGAATKTVHWQVIEFN